ncbi:hypothetical protein [Phytoactinopolyspora limicola]|uniref:hypothetical protein n=1 Tax=Phytoactinopolyspora limicola TaxID=2715536 RepID=UPI00140ADF12|nr:hypothetical protein [Phytoactinopolyspora limicola]
MKLLEEVSTAPTPRPSGKRVVVTMTATLLLVIAATYFGYTMLTGPGSEADENAPVTMSVWVEEASAACHTVAEEHPVLTQGDDTRVDSDNVVRVAAGVQSLDARINDLSPLADTADQNAVEPIIALGAPARDAWNAIEADDAGSADDRADASQLTSTFVNGLVELGAECGVLD